MNMKLQDDYTPVALYCQSPGSPATARTWTSPWPPSCERSGTGCARYSGQPGGATAPLARDCRWPSMALQIRTGGTEGLRGELQEPCGQRIRR